MTRLDRIDKTRDRRFMIRAKRARNIQKSVNLHREGEQRPV